MNNLSAPIRVLIADDHVIVRRGIREFLKRADDILIVAEAGDGEAAQRLIQETQPDVAVLDIQMPKASGIAVTHWIRANFLGIGVLILTAYDDDPYVMAVLRAGANGYVLKTASPVEIIQAVRDVHCGKSAINDGIAQKVIAQITRQASSPRMEPLTGREMEVLELTAKGNTNKSIGAHLGISDRTVQGHLANIYAKLRATSRTEAVMRAVSLGWISEEVTTNPRSFSSETEAHSAFNPSNEV